jgi:hypothetical protein
MTKLTDTQLVILSAAARRPDRGIFLPSHLKGGAARIVADRLIARALIEEVRAAAGLPVWRSSEDGSFALRITPAGLAAIGV